MTSFADVSSDTQVQNDLASLYGSVDRIDPLVGMLAEDRLPESLFGETSHALYQLQFNAIRSGDRLWHQARLEEPTFRKAVGSAGLTVEREDGTWTLDRSLASLLRDNSTVGGRGDITRLRGNTNALLVMD